MKRKELSVEVQESTATGGRIRITTGALDRQLDRILPSGAQIDNYMKNPIVQWGHNYYEPWATIGQTERLEVDGDGITAEFTLREPVNDADPMTIIRALWSQGLIKTASIGFNPTQWEHNDDGGFDITEWELLEWSLVPVPANQEALRLAVKSLDLTQDQQRLATSDTTPNPTGNTDVTNTDVTNTDVTNTDVTNTDVTDELSPEEKQALTDAFNQLSAALSALTEVQHV